MTADTNQVVVEWGVDSGPDYTHCIHCGKFHALFPGADLCTECRKRRQEQAKKTKDRGECRGGCGCTVQWSVFRCGRCRAENKWAAKPVGKAVSNDTAIDWNNLAKSRGNSGEVKKRQVEIYLQQRSK